MRLERVYLMFMQLQWVCSIRWHGVRFYFLFFCKFIFHWALSKWCSFLDIVIYWFELDTCSSQFLFYFAEQFFNICKELVVSVLVPPTADSGFSSKNIFWFLLNVYLSSVILLCLKSFVFDLLEFGRVHCVTKKWHPRSKSTISFHPLAAVGDISRLPARVREADFVAREFD